MADTVQFDLVSPERLLASVQVTEVKMPGTEGDMTAMPGHSPVILTLRPGIVRVVSAEGEDEYAVTGGFAEINADSISLLAERAIHRTDLTQEQFNDLLEEAKVRLEKARETFKNEPGPVDDAAKLLSDMVAMGEHMGLSGY
ncbi:F0F1 ATP synthase subunit epsilon [Roseovarius nanhaiticus]|uniref:ATP synthase epsilon chain n=1 Tax=Roseovarius nanhaiticus TaxID=573024 RepID=A0A1N7H3D7_9RHOB|nr:F0F1 ATP synthase subunit epsilon [Roseovarius nanhaiticus]SEL14672.1 ATP synthase F1 subcomplex epsilon subunit [Roseovarius nanhaiticus]SIS19336.1 ATP synthase F1 subcomplex epsilon subunit [Roseovarius nanhaiticus]